METRSLATTPAQRIHQGARPPRRFTPLLLQDPAQGEPWAARQLLTLPAAAAGEHRGLAQRPARRHRHRSRRVPGAASPQGKPGCELGGGRAAALGRKSGRLTGLRVLSGALGAPCPGSTQPQCPGAEGRPGHFSSTADVEAASAFNVGAAVNSVHSPRDLHPEGCRCPHLFCAHTAPPTPAHSSSSPRYLAPLRCGLQRAAFSALPGPSPRAAQGGSPGPARSSAGRRSPITAAATGRSGWSWLEPRLR